MGLGDGSFDKQPNNFGNIGIIDQIPKNIHKRSPQQYILSLATTQINNPQIKAHIPFSRTARYLKQIMPATEANKIPKQSKTPIGNKDNRMQVRDKIADTLHIQNRQIQATIFRLFSFLASCDFILVFLFLLYIYICILCFVLIIYYFVIIFICNLLAEFGIFVIRLYCCCSIVSVIIVCTLQYSNLVIYNESLKSRAFTQFQVQMQSESSRPVRQSIAAKRVSVTSQKRSSYLPENQRQLDFKTTNFSDLQPVFDSTSGSLTQLFVQSFNNVSRSGNKAMMHVGICLQSEQIFIFLKQLFMETGKSINGLTRQFDRQRETKQLYSRIYFAPFWQYKIENCAIIFWILLSNNIQEIIRRSQYNAELDLFVSYPQLIIINSFSYEWLAGRKICLSQKLRFRQQICILKDRNLAINPQNSSRRLQERQHSKYETQIHMVGATVDKRSFLQLIPTIMKKNSIRCFNQLQKINLYLLQAISNANSKLKQIKNEQQENIQLQQVIDRAVSAYLSAQQQKQKQFPVLPYPQKQLETLLNSLEQQKMQNIRTNIRVLYHSSPQKQSHLLAAAQKKILLKNQQVLMNNRQLTKKYNKELLNQLYEKLLGQFEKGKYGGKDKTQAMTEDLSNFIDEFGKKGIKSSTMFEIFNNFMKNNKAKYYDKIQELQQKIDQNRKITNFDDIFDKIQMKKRVLVTLQKQVKNLQQKKLQVEQQNEHLKQYQKQINQRHLESEGDELAEADSIKTFKTKPLSSNSPRLMNRGYNKQMYGANDNKKMEMMALNIQGKKKSKGKGKSKKKGCCSCRCNIF